MSVLMLMRQRMKAIETIQKITHAMRLISMSSHTRLRNKKIALTHYAKELSDLFAEILPHAPEWRDPRLMPKTPATNHQRTLLILIGSQKGLCGTFNQSLFSYFERTQGKVTDQKVDLITVGRRASDYIHHEKKYTPLKEFNEFTHTSFVTIAQQIADSILHETPCYTKVIVYSNWSKSFFAQMPSHKAIIPLGLPEPVASDFDVHEGFTWEQSPEYLLTHLAQSLLFATLQDILLTSLTAEQAARFVAMDNSTRNARNLLDEMTLDYNKRRQAKITRELTDLIGSL